MPWWRFKEGSQLLTVNCMCRAAAYDSVCRCVLPHLFVIAINLVVQGSSIAARAEAGARSLINLIIKKCLFGQSLHTQKQGGSFIAETTCTKGVGFRVGRGSTTLAGVHLDLWQAWVTQARLAALRGLAPAPSSPTVDWSTSHAQAAFRLTLTSTWLKPPNTFDLLRA